MGDLRVAARVLLFDPAGRLLLSRGVDPAEPGVPFRFTVGSGVDPGGFDLIESRTISAHRWWGTAELRSTADELDAWDGRVRPIA